jgi:hypothetical protein
MTGLKIGYSPLSTNMNSAGDRRRLVLWAEARGHSIVTDLSKKVDLLVVSENSDFNSPAFNQERIPILFDLVDAYLSPLNSFDDLARGVAKKLTGQISGSIKPFSHHVRDFCKKSNAVICSSVEQKEVIRKYNQNTHVILDNHEEIPMNNFSLKPRKPSRSQRILWEGLPATVPGVGQISSVLSNLAETFNLQLDFVTDEKYFQYMNRFLERETLKLLKSNLDGLADQINVVPWSPENLVKRAQVSSLAIIPINLSVPMQRLKPENRLLIMWRLGLPCLASASPAYSRVALLAGTDVVCNDLEEWKIKSTRILADRDYAKQQVTNGQNYLRENHSQSIILNKWDRAVESVMR